MEIFQNVKNRPQTSWQNASYGYYSDSNLVLSRCTAVYMCYYRQISGMLREIHHFNGRLLPPERRPQNTPHVSYLSRPIRRIETLRKSKIHCFPAAVTRNQNHHLEGNAVPTGHSHTNAHYACEVNNYLNSNHTKYLSQFCGRFFAF